MSSILQRCFVGARRCCGLLRGFNAVGTTHLLDAIASLQSVPRRVVVASSANVYGNSTVEPITEATPPAPVNHYAASKMAMEAMARTYVDRLPLVITRPFNYTGVGGQVDHFLVPKLVAHFAERRRFDRTRQSGCRA